MEIDVQTLNRIIEMHVATYSRIIVGQVSAMIGSREPPLGRDAIIKNYDPTDGTVEVIFGDGAAIIQGPGGDGDTPPTERRVPLLVTHHGDQFGPVGGERCVVVPTQSGYAALMIYDEDDSPNATQGERWITHRNAAGVVDSVVKLTNDGPLTSDGLGGLHTGGGALTQNTTAGGHSDTFTDAIGAAAIIREASDGTSKTIHDAETHEVSHLGQNVTLGARLATMDATHAAYNKSHITSLMTNNQASRIQDLSTMAAAMLTAGVPNAAGVATALLALSSAPSPLGILAAIVPLPTIPGGSPIVKLSS